MGTGCPLGRSVPFPTTSYLFGVCLKAGTGLTTAGVGTPALCRRKGGGEEPPSRQGCAGGAWVAVHLCVLGTSVSFPVALQQDGSDGPRAASQPT